MTAVFLDRDGVINVAERGKWINHEDDFELYPFTIEAMQLLSKANVPIFITTNQSGVASGDLKHSQYYAITAKMLEMFEKHSVNVTRVLECLHSKNPVSCTCRKPGIGMLERAYHEYNLHGTAWLVGDMHTDIEAALEFNKNYCESFTWGAPPLKITPILVRTGLCDDATLNKAVGLTEEERGELFIEESLLEAAHRIYSSYSGSS